MKQQVFTADNPLDLSSWQEHETDDIHGLLKSIYPVFPPTCRIYRKHVAVSHDVTPHDEMSALALGSIKDPLYVVVYPAWEQLAIAAIIYVVSWVITEMTERKVAKPREHTFAQGSPNNSLSERRNRARLHERVPDILGTVRSVPDLIMWTYTVYENHRPVDYSWMCVSKDSASVTDIRESDTPFSQILNASAVVYPPGQAPGGGTPNLVIGEMITEPVYNVYQVKAINGQELPAMNAFYIWGTSLNAETLRQFNRFATAEFMKLTATTGAMVLPSTGDTEYVTNRIQAGDELQVIWGALGAGGGGPIPDLSAGFGFSPTVTIFPAGVGIPPLRGDLEPLIVTSVTTRDNQLVEVQFNIPASLQSEWDKIVAPYTPFLDDVHGVPIVQNKNVTIAAQNRWLLGYDPGSVSPDTGGIFIDDPNAQQIWMNFVAQRGLYLEDGANRRVLNQAISWKVTPCDVNGTPTGPGFEDSVELEGSIIGGETRAVTVKYVMPFTGRCLLIIARTAFRPRQVELDPDTTRYFKTREFDLVEVDRDDQNAFTGSIIDDIRITECYAMSEPVTPLGAQVTTIHSRVVANDSAARIQERELNCLATRNTLAWNGSAFTTPIDTQGFGENMLFHVMKDPFIGNRANAEIDFAGIAAAAAAVRTYFGDENATRFSYTFDDHNMSFEETVLTICRSIHLTPYRQGNLIKCDPDIATDNSTVLFNHRNKKPGTETRTFSFGLLNDNDGVEQSYTDVDTGIGNVQPISQFLSQPTVVAPVQSRIVGLRFRWQAWVHAYRQLFRLIHQNLAVEFEALAEAGQVGLNQRILVEDNTRPDVQDGEVVSSSGLIIRTSQPVVDAGGTYTVFLQQKDATVEAIPCTPGVPDSHSITLSIAPTNPVIVDSNFGVPTTYILSRDQDTKSKAFLVTEKTEKTRLTWTLQAINYSHMYYAADALTLWIIPSTEVSGEEFFDRSPYERTNLADNTMLGSDVVWGPVYDSVVGFLTNSNLAAHLIAYTKTCWIKMDAPALTGAILDSETGSPAVEFFAINSAGELVAGHGAIHVAAVIPGSVTDWHHYAVTYDSLTGEMIAYIDGEGVAGATSVPTRVLSGLMAFNSADHGPLQGQAKHLRHYCRTLSPFMVRELYQKELLQP